MTEEEFLKIIRQIESSGGKNINHPMVHHGVNKGTKAIGEYALMPATVDELVKRKVEYQNLASMTPEQKQQYLEKNPQLQRKLAGFMYEHLKDRYNNNPIQMAAAYNQGMYLPPERLSPERTDKMDYVNKFKRLAQKISGNDIEQANIVPETQKIAKNIPNELPTIDVASLESILNDPNNPFNQMDEDEDSDELLKKQGMLGYL